MSDAETLSRETILSPETARLLLESGCSLRMARVLVGYLSERGISPAPLVVPFFRALRRTAEQYGEAEAARQIAGESDGVLGLLGEAAAKRWEKKGGGK